MGNQKNKKRPRKKQLKGAVKIQRLTEEASAQNRPTGNEHIPEIEEPVPVQEKPK